MMLELNQRNVRCDIYNMIYSVVHIDCEATLNKLSILNAPMVVGATYVINLEYDESCGYDGYQVDVHEVSEFIKQVEGLLSNISKADKELVALFKHNRSCP